MKKTEVEQLTGLSYAQITHAIYSRKIPRPCKDASGDYVWTEADVQRLLAAVAVDRRRKNQKQVA